MEIEERLKESSGWRRGEIKLDQNISSISIEKMESEMSAFNSSMISDNVYGLESNFSWGLNQSSSVSSFRNYSSLNWTSVSKKPEINK